jgi:DNA invertase Pin-like site-specific DNA recombinase
VRAVGLYRSDRSPASSSGDEPDHAAEIHNYCERNQHQLINTYATDSPAAQEKAYQAIAESFRAGRPALVVLPDATHLGDDLESFVERMIELSELGGEVRCTDVERPDPLQSAEELLTLKGRSAIRQRRVREAIMAKASRGQVLGRTPYGYTTGTNGQLQENPVEAEVVRKIFELYAGPWSTPGGPPLGGIGLRLVAQRLNEQGLRTRQGHPWTQVAVAGILRNRVYLGTYTRYGERIVGSHPPLVERELFNRAEAVTEMRRPVRRSRKSEPFLLSGLLRSQVSGRGLFGLTRKRAWKRQDGTPVEKTYRYYECPHREPAPDGFGESDSNADTTVDIKLSWPAEKLEQAVREQVASWPDVCFQDATLVEDESAPGPADQVKLCEREFNRAVRGGAAGYGTFRDLRQPLEELAIARRLAEEPIEATYDDATLRKMALADDIATARPALLAVIERISVGPESVDVVPRRKN